MNVIKNKIIIKGGTIIDGTGKVPYLGDLIIEDDKIKAIIQPKPIFEKNTCEIYDAENCIVCPGFIDAHAHDDIALLKTPNQINKIKMGVTTVINGNCGVSASPLCPENFDKIRSTIVGILIKSKEHCFPKFHDYISTLKDKCPVTNYATFIGHNTIRCNTMKKYNKNPSNQEMKNMKKMIQEAMEIGALGLSTGLTYIPSLTSTTSEIVELVKVISSYNGIYSTHIRNEADKLEEAVSEAIYIASQNNVTLQLSHHKAIGRRNYGKILKTLDQIETASHSGQKIFLDVYPYTSISTDLKTLIVQQGLDESEIGDCVIAFSERFPEVSGKTVREISKTWRIPRKEAIGRLLPAIGTYCCLSEDDVCSLLRHPLVMIGSDGIPSEGFPHPRLYGTFAKVLRKYVIQKKVLNLETAIKKMTSFPANAFDLKKRGKICKNYYADVIVFNLNEVLDCATYDNSKEYSKGFKHVFINGKCVINDYRVVFKCSGRFLK